MNETSVKGREAVATPEQILYTSVESKGVSVLASMAIAVLAEADTYGILNALAAER